MWLDEEDDDTRPREVPNLYVTDDTSNYAMSFSKIA